MTSRSFFASRCKSPEGMPFSRTCTIPTPPDTASVTTFSRGACNLREESVTRQSLGSCVGLGIGPGGLQEELVEGSEGQGRYLLGDFLDG